MFSLLDYSNLPRLCWSLLLLLCAALGYWCGMSFFVIWKSQGVRGPKPAPFLGNTIEILRLGFVQFFSRYLKVFGNIFGMYVGRRPVLVVANLDLLRQIMVTQFSKFSDRADSLRHPVLKQGLHHLTGEDWTRVRSAVSPMFSAAQVKMMLPLIKESVKELSRKLDMAARDGRTMDVASMLSKLTLEVMLRCVFGMQPQTQQNVKDEYMRSAKDLTVVSPVEAFIGYCAPKLQAWYLRLFGRSGPGNLARIAKLVSLLKVDNYLQRACIASKFDNIWSN